MKPISLSLISLLSLSALNAEMILHEPFDVEVQESEPTLGKQNDWQFGFNNEEPSQTMVRDGHVHTGVSPFEPKGVCIQPISTKKGCYKKLPREINGETIYFSYVMNSFKRGNFSGLRFRSKKGQLIGVGITEDGFFGTVFNKDKEHTGIGDIKTRYMVLGKLEISKDGNEAKLSFTWVDNVNDIPNPEPQEWKVELEAKTGPQDWDAVEFHAASGSTAFDDLRISTSWVDVAGK